MKLSRAVLQQCVSARLLVKPATDEQPADYVKISNGVVIFICFMKGANSILIPKLVKCLLEIKLSYCAKQNKRVSILELPGDILIVPQATLGGKVKGKVVHIFRYHNNIDKEAGEVLYQRFVDHVKEVFEENRIHLPNECSVKNGTYGNLQVLSMETNGPYTHVIDM
ncbi:D-aminoacyl-tRNA deacylase 2 isoform X1 [Hydra vulgaris]|uniref:D-aminoacyl-tRNA deacylase 2 isoform X1 n=1 Tax=Hydra vulgaris TaxID=6087 RepID=UPI0032E9E351